MWQYFRDALTWLWNLWQGIPNDIKDRIIDAVVEWFGKLLRDFYQRFSQTQES